MDFGALPPEINSGRMYTGPGSGPILTAAAAWDQLAAELGSAASVYGSVISGLTSEGWLGSSSTTMAAAAAPYVAWMSSTAAQAEQTAVQARAAAGAYETAFGATVPPPEIAANRAQLLSLEATNFFGQNSPAIATTEAQYAEMWAQDAAAMYGYASASSTASTVTPFTAAPQTTNSGGQTGQVAAVTQAAATPAGNATSNVASATAQVTPTSLLQELQQELQQLLSPNSTTSTLPIPLPSWLSGGITTSNYTALKSTIGDLGYFPLGLTQFNASIGQQLIPGSAGGAGASGSAPLPGAGLPPLTGVGGPVSGAVGQAGTIGRLSVPPSWAAATTPASPTGATLTSSISAAPEMAGSNGPGGLLRGIPLGGTGRRGASGFVHRYGFRHSVMARPPVGG